MDPRPRRDAAPSALALVALAPCPSDAALALARLVDAEFATLYNLDGSVEDLDACDGDIGTGEEVPPGAWVSLRRDTLRQAERAQGAFLAPVLAGDGEAGRDAGLAVSYLLVVPIRGPEGIAKVLVTGLRDLPRSPARTLWLAECHASLVALCLNDPGAYHQLLDAGQIDWLTGCLTFRALERELRREVTRAARNGLPLTCCFIDLDDFKGVNDRHGHVYGNDVLAWVGRTLRAGVRACDTVGRYGGDEFVAVLPQTSIGEAAAIAARLQAGIDAIALPGRPRTHLSASIGLAQWRHGQTPDAILADADAALLDAKARRERARDNASGGAA